MKNMERRGISDIIAVLLLLGITVAGAVLVSAFFQGNNIFRYDANTSGSQTASLKITGYDTRVGLSLSQITSFDNTPPADSTLTKNQDFIVINVMNQGINKIVLQSVQINDVDHKWDSNAPPVGSKGAAFPATKPASGLFSILSTSSSTPQLSTNEIDRNQEVRLIIKLSNSLSDISLNEPIRVQFTTNLIDSSAVVITSGGVR